MSHLIRYPVEGGTSDVDPADAAALDAGDDDFLSPLLAVGRGDDDAAAFFLETRAEAPPLLFAAPPRLFAFRFLLPAALAPVDEDMLLLCCVEGKMACGLCEVVSLISLNCCLAPSVPVNKRHHESFVTSTIIPGTGVLRLKNAWACHCETGGTMDYSVERAKDNNSIPDAYVGLLENMGTESGPC